MPHYLFLGTDKRSLEQQDAKLADLKAALFSSHDALRFDWEELDGKKLTTERLKIALVSLPALAKKRVIVIRQADKLSKECGELLGGFLSSGEDEGFAIVLQTEEGELKAALRKAVEGRFQTVGAVPRPTNVFNMMDELQDTARALKLLNGLFDQGDAPEALLGGMVWVWANKMKARVKADSYKKGLLVLQEADHHLKRSKFPERGYALEVAVVKLSSLLKA
ncbi:MAG: hypothetical protein HQL18_04515 [Candidatus Omnitrophica bacterium]|nr:hypothetical protein [Candidatus Omnitrophota bacterium]